MSCPPTLREQDIIELDTVLYIIIALEVEERVLLLSESPNSATSQDWPCGVSCSLVDDFTYLPR